MNYLNSNKVLLVISCVVFGLISIWLISALALLYFAPKVIYNLNSQASRENLNFKYTTINVKNSKNENLEFWFIENSNTTQAIIYLHGNAGPIPNFIKGLSEKFNVVVPFYPGFGLSEGSPTPKNSIEAAELSLKYLEQKGFTKDKITLWGHSLGGAVAIDLASRNNDLKKLVLVGTFSSMQSMCSRKYTGIMCIFGGSIFNSRYLAPKITLPVRQFHTLNDETIPFEEGKTLFDFFSSQDKKFVEYEGTHTEVEINLTLQE